MENRLWYTKSATCFEEAVPIGNGKSGAMVYGGVREEHLLLNYDELYSGQSFTVYKQGTPSLQKMIRELVLLGDLDEATELVRREFNDKYTAKYEPLGTLHIKLPKASRRGYVRELDLSRGVATTKCGDSVRTAFCPCKGKGYIYSVTNETDAEIFIDIPHKCELISKDNYIFVKGEMPTYVLTPDQSPTDKEEIEYFGNSIEFGFCVVCVSDGIVIANDGRLTITKASYIHLFMDCESSFSEKGFAKKALDNAKKMSVQDLSTQLQKHIKAFSAVYNRMSVNLGGNDDSGVDTYTRLQNGASVGLVELLFNYGRYLTISSSAPGSRATNLQGIWNEHMNAPWSSAYTTNINLEMNYWPTLAVNLSEYYEPIISFIKLLCERGKDCARDFYGAPGFCAHHNSDIFGDPYPCGYRVASSDRWGYWNGAGGWLCEHLFRYYEYTLDKDYLKSVAYPIMKEAALFYESQLVSVDGRLALCPSTSPENQYQINGKPYAIAKYTTMTQTIIYELFDNLVKASSILNCDKKFASKMDKLKKRLKPFVVMSDGRLQEWDAEYEEVDYNHRHASHLYGVYPAGIVTNEAMPKIMKAAQKTLDRRGDDGTGWSLAWKANLWARLGDGDHAMRLIYRQLKFVEPAGARVSLKGGTFANMLDGHTPFQIDGNFGITSAILQLFIQTEIGSIKLLPALPSNMQSGSIKGIKAKGNVSVDMAWENGNLSLLSLKSPVSQSIKLSANGKTQTVMLVANKKLTIKY